MPRRILGPCKYPNCPNRAIEGGGGYCDIHQGVYLKEKSEKAKAYNKNDRGYDSNKRYGARWAKIRNVYIREHPFCEMCQSKGINKLAVLVHHIKPIANGGDDSYDNLMALCAGCHEDIHHQNKDR